MSAGHLTVKHFYDLFDAFNRHDIDAIMAFFSDDCLFYAVGGTEICGTRIEGRNAIAEAFSGVWAAMPDASWDNHKHLVADNRVISEWTFRGTDANGNRIEAEGCDLFTQQDGKIIRKQAFRKNRPLLKA